MNIFLVFLTILLQSIIPFAVSKAALINSPPLTVSIVGSDMYVRTSYDVKGHDKVWRLKVNQPASKTSNGVVDFVGERLIESATLQIMTIPQYRKKGLMSLNLNRKMV